jgi:colicin import membrane protein
VAKTRAQRKAERRAREERARREAERAVRRETVAEAEPEAPEAPETPETPEAPAPSRADTPDAEQTAVDREVEERQRRAEEERQRQIAERQREIEERRAEQEGRQKLERAKEAAPAEERQRNVAFAFLASCWAELKRVQWPDRPTLFQASAVTVVFVAVAAAYLGALDALFNLIVKQIL